MSSSFHTPVRFERLMTMDVGNEQRGSSAAQDDNDWMGHSQSFPWGATDTSQMVGGYVQEAPVVMAPDGCWYAWMPVAQPWAEPPVSRPPPILKTIRVRPSWDTTADWLVCTIPLLESEYKGDTMNSSNEPQKDASLPAASDQNPANDAPELSWAMPEQTVEQFCHEHILPQLSQSSWELLIRQYYYPAMYHRRHCPGAYPPSMFPIKKGSKQPSASSSPFPVSLRLFLSLPGRSVGKTETQVLVQHNDDDDTRRPLNQRVPLFAIQLALRSITSGALWRPGDAIHDLVTEYQESVELQVRLVGCHGVSSWEPAADSSRIPDMVVCLSSVDRRRQRTTSPARKSSNATADSELDQSPMRQDDSATPRAGTTITTFAVTTPPPRKRKAAPTPPSTPPAAVTQDSALDLPPLSPGQLVDNNNLPVRDQSPGPLAAPGPKRSREDENGHDMVVSPPKKLTRTTTANAFAATQDQLSGENTAAGMGERSESPDADENQTVSSEVDNIVEVTGIDQGETASLGSYLSARMEPPSDKDDDDVSTSSHSTSTSSSSGSSSSSSSSSSSDSSGSTSSSESSDSSAASSNTSKSSHSSVGSVAASGDKLEVQVDPAPIENKVGLPVRPDAEDRHDFDHGSEASGDENSEGRFSNVVETANHADDTKSDAGPIENDDESSSSSSTSSSSSSSSSTSSSASTASSESKVNSKSSNIPAPSSTFPTSLNGNIGGDSGGISEAGLTATDKLNPADRFTTEASGIGLEKRSVVERTAEASGEQPMRHTELGDDDASIHSSSSSRSASSSSGSDSSSVSSATTAASSSSSDALPAVAHQSADQNDIASADSRGAVPGGRNAQFETSKANGSATKTKRPPLLSPSRPIII
jgi:hypothetical protein